MGISILMALRFQSQPPFPVNWKMCCCLAGQAGQLPAINGNNNNRLENVFHSYVPKVEKIVSNEKNLDRPPRVHMQRSTLDGRILKID